MSIDLNESANFTDEFDFFPSEEKNEPTVIKIEGTKKNASISTEVLTFQEGLVFCKKRDKTMPDDVFEIAEEGLDFSL